MIESNDIIFDRNNTVRDESVSQEEKIIRARVFNKLLNIFKANGLISIPGDPDIIDDDMLQIGQIYDKTLIIDIHPVVIKIDLGYAIQNAMLQKKPSVLYRMMKQNIDLSKFEPCVMIMCVETEQDDLMLEMINNKIRIDIEQFRCVYRLAELGKLNLLEKILDRYEFSNLPEIVCKICIKAVIFNHVHILEHFFPKEVFGSVPDQMFTFFINSIKYGSHLGVIEFFIKNGIDIRQRGYRAVLTAIEFDEQAVIKYFCEIDSEVINLLSDDQKEKFGMVPLLLKNQYIGTNVSCNISYDDILNDDTYFQCNNKIHYYKENMWNKWMQIKYDWKCPCCFCSVDKILYVNKMND